MMIIIIIISNNKKNNNIIIVSESLPSNRWSVPIWHLRLSGLVGDPPTWMILERIKLETPEK